MGNSTSTEESTSPGKLIFTRKEELPRGDACTDVYQVENGTIFYHYRGSQFTKDSRLYVKWKGDEVGAKLPKTHIFEPVTHGNALYFSASRPREVYKAVFSDGRINISHVRTTRKGESLFDGISTIEKNGKKFVCNMFADPDRDGILIDLAESELEGLRLVAIHRGRAIYLKKCESYNKALRPRVQKWSDNYIIIHECLSLTISCTDSSPFVYIGSKLDTLDSRTMKFLPRLELEGIDRVEGTLRAIGGVIAVCGHVGGAERGEYLATAKLPVGYY